MILNNIVIKVGYIVEEIIKFWTYILQLATLRVTLTNQPISCQVKCDGIIRKVASCKMYVHNLINFSTIYPYWMPEIFVCIVKG